MKPRSIIRWQHRLNREHPTCTERQSLIEECGWKGGDSGDSAGKKQHDQQIPKPIPLTPTGLLMEGDYTSYGVNECNGDFSPVMRPYCFTNGYRSLSP